jgi:hypothetical protein
MIEHDASKETLFKEMEVVNANLQTLKKNLIFFALYWKINDKVQCKVKMPSKIQSWICGKLILTLCQY